MRSLVPASFAPIHESQPGINAFGSELDLSPVVGQPAPASKSSSSGVTLLFQNQTQKSIRIVWLDENGKRHDPIIIASASRYLLKTFAGYTWVLVDADDKDMGHVVASDRPARVIVQE